MFTKLCIDVHIYLSCFGSKRFFFLITASCSRLELTQNGPINSFSTKSQVNVPKNNCTVIVFVDTNLQNEILNVYKVKIFFYLFYKDYISFRNCRNANIVVVCNNC